MNVGDFLISDQDVWIFKNSFHFIRICNHVRGNVATVELHTFNNFKLSNEAFGFFNCDNAVVADFLHSFSDQLAYFFVSGRDRSNLCDGLFAFDWLGRSFQFFNSSFNCFLDTFADNHWVSACSYVLQAFANHRLCKNSCSCCTVTGNIICFGSYFFNKLSAHVLKCIFKLDFFSDGYTIIRDQRAAEFFLQNDVTAFRTQVLLLLHLPKHQHREALRGERLH